ncbi:hypothetical protein [Actinomadura roseirufa]|uniref:hypothetical protein n=1 Tax=Actinomadura roseirufa TaxID=2094049 RepID=UPI0010415725|nr:hypothetical protein [Actinomadura roseirufa]
MKMVKKLAVMAAATAAITGILSTPAQASGPVYRGSAGPDNCVGSFWTININGHDQARWHLEGEGTATCSIWVERTSSAGTQRLAYARYGNPVSMDGPWVDDRSPYKARVCSYATPFGTNDMIGGCTNWY